jgi:cation transporter-like permease
MASTAPTAAQSAIESELVLLRQQNKELQSELNRLQSQFSQHSNGVKQGNGLPTPSIVSNSLNHRRSSHDEDVIRPKTPASGLPVELEAAPLIPHVEGTETPKQSNRKNPTSSPLDEEHGGIDKSSSTEETDDDADESEELIHDDSSHNKHQNRRRIRARVHHVETFWRDIKERAGWLIGLLFLQSCSSFIIQSNERFLQGHMVIVQFLTMLVGAGGNAGNQASVRVIRGLAVGTLNDRTMRPFLKNEVKMGFGLSALLGITGCIRAALFRTPLGETIAVTTSLCAIVLISVVLGNMLPLLMRKVGIDPAHSSTTIQVVMDIMGVLITVCVSSFVMSFKVFQHDKELDSSGETVT